MGRRVLRRHICGYAVCLCPIKGTPGLYKLRSEEKTQYICYVREMISGKSNAFMASSLGCIENSVTSSKCTLFSPLTDNFKCSALLESVGEEER